MIPVIRPVILRKKYVIPVIRINFKKNNSLVRFFELVKDHKDHVFFTQDHGPDHRDHAQLMGLQYGHAQHRRHRRRPPIVYDSLRVGSHVACAGGGDRGRPVGGSQDESCAPVAGARDGGQGLRGREAYHLPE